MAFNFSRFVLNKKIEVNNVVKIYFIRHVKYISKIIVVLKRKSLPFNDFLLGPRYRLSLKCTKCCHWKARVHNEW